MGLTRLVAFRSTCFIGWLPTATLAVSLASVAGENRDARPPPCPVRHDLSCIPSSPRRPQELVKKLSGGLDNRGDGLLAASLRGEALCEGNKRRMHRRRRASLEGYAADRARIRAS